MSASFVPHKTSFLGLCQFFGGQDVLNARNILCLFCSITLFVINGCSSFSKLTAIEADSTDGPIASDCGSCHVSQFKEWSLSRHASAYRDSVFQAEYSEGGDADCLVCHAPLLVRDDEPIPRPYNLAGGVDCISCHYLNGKMHGPHRASALFQPHPVEEKDEFYLRISLCARCHGETADEYEAEAKDHTLPTCLECHSAPVSRTASQGTDFLSDTLVSFEEQVETRSHDISLAAKMIDPSLMPITVTSLEDNSEQIEVEIVNNLPHNLPTGNFGQKSIRLLVPSSPGNKSNSQATALIADEAHPLAPGATAKIRLGIPTLLQTGDMVLIRLERLGAPADTRPPVILASKSFKLPLHDSK
jgi:hypothetical protein